MSDPSDCHAGFIVATGCVLVVWTSTAPNPVHYSIYREVNGSGFWVLLDSNVDPTAHTYTDCTVVDGVIYRYMIVSFDSEEFVDDDDLIWTDDEDDSWFSVTTCTTTPAITRFLQTW